MADLLPPTVRAFMIRTGRTTAAEADAKGMGVLDDLAVMDAVAIYSMCESAKKRDSLAVQKAALLIANAEMEKNNLSIQNWKERAMIAASTTWPTDQDSIDALIALLDSDTDIPGPPSTDPPTQQDATRDEIVASRDLNQKIRDELDKAAKAGTSEPFTTNRELAQSFSAWLERHGVEPSHANDLVSFDGTNYVEKSTFMSPFTLQTMPTLVSLPDGATNYWMGKEFGKDPVVFELIENTSQTKLQARNARDLHDGIGVDGGDHVVDTPFWLTIDDRDIEWGKVYKNGDHYFWVNEIYAKPYPPLMPANLGSEVDTDGDGTKERIWSNGVDFYEVDDSYLTKDWLADGGAASIQDGLRQGTPYLGFTAGGGPLFKVEPKDAYIADPSPEERGNWAIHFDDQMDKFQANNNLWSAQSGAQQVRMQDDVAQYASLLGISSNISQNNSRMLERLLPGR